MNKHDKAFGTLLKAKREAAGMSQVAVARLLRWPQAKVSRLEQGKRSATLPELLAFAQAFRLPVNEMLGELAGTRALQEGGVSPVTAAPPLSPGFLAAYDSEDELLSQLARYGVRFLGAGGRPAFHALPVHEVLLAALRFSRDARVFESLPALLLKHAAQVDWDKLVAAAYALKLQNRLGMVVAAALALRDDAVGQDRAVWNKLQSVHDALAEAKLDREEVLGPVPKTDAAWSFLRERTPAWLRFWHGVGSGDLDSFRRYLAR